MAVTFDGDNLRIILESGVTEVDIEQDLYSAWKTWFKSSDNSKYAVAFRTFGGDPLSASIDAGAYFIFQNQNGWRVRPAEEDLTVFFNGNIAPEDGDLSIVVPTLGAYTVLLLGLQPITQNQAALEAALFNGGVTVDVVNGVAGTGGLIGTPNKPVNNTPDAVAIAASRGLTKLFIVGDITFTTGNNISGFHVEGESSIKSLITVDSGAISNDAEFHECSLQGTLDPGATVHDSTILNLSFFEGFLHDCALDGTIVLGGSNETHIVNCHDATAGAGPSITTIDMGGSGRGLIVRNFEGGLELINKNGTEAVSIGISLGRLVLDSSITNGEIVVRIVAGELEDNSVGATVIANSVLNPSTISRNSLNLIESQRGHHTATGNVFYWDPINGDDTKDGLTPITAKFTWGGATGVNSLVVANRHDVIIIEPGEVGGTTVIQEQITLDKEYTFLRGPGRDVHFLPTATTGVTVAVSATGCEFSGARVSTAPTGDGEAVEVSGADFAYLHDLWIEQCQGDGIRLLNVSHSKLKNLHIRNCQGDAVVFRGITQDCKYNQLLDASILDNVGNGVLFDGVNCQHNYIWGGVDGVTIMMNGGWGILEQNNADYNHAIGPIIHMHENTLGDFQFIGGDSGVESVGPYATSAQADRNAALIERARGHHTWSGNLFYVDPVNGDTIANGADGSKAKPLSTVQECHDALVTDNNHDVIILIPGSAGGETTMTEDVVISKRYVFIHGPGRDFVWTRSGAGHTISVTGDGAELSGFQLKTDTVGAGSGISTSGVDFVYIHNLYINGTQGDGITISNSPNAVIEDNVLNMTGVSGAGHGIQVDPAGGGSNHPSIRRNHIAHVFGNGIWIKGASVEHPNVVDSEIHDCSGWGIKVEAGVTDTFLAGNILGNNASGDISDEGTDTVRVNNEQWATWTKVLENTLTMEEAQRIMLAVLVGKSNATQGPNRVVYRDVADAKDRVNSLHSNDGDRTSVVLDGSP